MKNLIIPILIILIFSNFLSAQIINIPADYPTIQQGIDSAVDGDTVLVMPGTYFVDSISPINFNGKSIIVASYYVLNQDTMSIANTIISGNTENEYLVIFQNGEDSTSQLSGFTLKDGYSAIYCENNSSPTLSHLKITDIQYLNGALLRGVISCFESDPTIRHLEFENNYSQSGFHLRNSNSFLHHINIMNNYLGEVFYLDNSDPTISNTNVINNEIVFNALESINSNFILENTVLDNNNCSNIHLSHSFPKITNIKLLGYGSGTIYLYDSYPVFRNSLLSLITGSNGSSMAIYGFNSNLRLYNVTIIGYDYCFYRSPGTSTFFNVFIESSIICDFNKELFSQMESEDFIITYSNIEGGWEGLGNIDENPLFVNTGEHPYQISDNSPCIDAGSIDTTGITEFDLANELRFINDRIDMGAYEWNTFVGIPKVNVLASDEINVFPIPVCTNINFSVNSNKIVDRLIIYNMSGQIIGEFNYPKNSISISHLERGVYLLVFISENNVIRKKIVKY